METKIPEKKALRKEMSCRRDKRSRRIFGKQAGLFLKDFVLRIFTGRPLLFFPMPAFAAKWIHGLLTGRCLPTAKS